MGRRAGWKGRKGVHARKVSCSALQAGHTVSHKCLWVCFRNLRDLYSKFDCSAEGWGLSSEILG